MRAWIVPVISPIMCPKFMSSPCLQQSVRPGSLQRIQMISLQSLQREWSHHNQKIFHDGNEVHSSCEVAALMQIQSLVHMSVTATCPGPALSATFGTLQHSKSVHKTVTALSSSLLKQSAHKCIANGAPPGEPHTAQILQRLFGRQ